MEMILYLFGNWCCIGAAGIVISFYWSGAGSRQDADILVSKDSIMMLALGSFLRAYWSMSPPPIWYDEVDLVQDIAVSDLFFSMIVWVVCAVVVFKHGKDTRGSEIDAQEEVYADPAFAKANKWSKFRRMVQFQYVVPAVFVFSFFGSAMLPSLYTEEAWPFVDFIVIFNMMLDGVAMIPQVVLVVSAKVRASAESGSFMGLLCLGRVMRMMFWFWLLAHPDSGHALWTFIIPDLFHTLIMADYLFHWLAKVKRDTLDPIMGDLMQV